jgi:hypothetical protein
MHSLNWIVSIRIGRTTTASALDLASPPQYAAVLVHQLLCIASIDGLRKLPLFPARAFLDQVEQYIRKSHIRAVLEVDPILGTT